MACQSARQIHQQRKCCRTTLARLLSHWASAMQTQTAASCLVATTASPGRIGRVGTKVSTPHARAARPGKIAREMGPSSCIVKRHRGGFVKEIHSDTCPRVFHITISYPVPRAEHCISACRLHVLGNGGDGLFTRRTPLPFECIPPSCDMNTFKIPVTALRGICRLRTGTLPPSNLCHRLQMAGRHHGRTMSRHGIGRGDQ